MCVCWGLQVTLPGLQTLKTLQTEHIYFPNQPKMSAPSISCSPLAAAGHNIIVKGAFTIVS